jgi:DNA polymerase-3 subunit delta'
MTENWDLLAHDWAVRMLRGQLAAGRLRHAYLFTGPSGVGRRTLALRLAQAANCTTPPAPGEFCGACRPCRGFGAMQHADLFVIKRLEDDSKIKVDAIRELSRALSRTPLEAKFQVALLLNFEQANEEASNALLKTLEEPSPSVLLCLTAIDTDSLPETIVSRCEIVRLRPTPVEPLGRQLSAHLKIDAPQAALLASLSGGRPGLALRLYQQPELLQQRSEWLDACQQLLSYKRVERFAFADRASKDRDGLRDLLLVWLSFWRDVLLRSARSAAAPANLDRAEQLEILAKTLSPLAVRRWVSSLEHTLEQLTTNVNARLAMEALLLELPGL